MMLSPDMHPFKIIQLEETSSTNDYLKGLSLKDQVEEFTVAVAEFQASGKGQRGNSWEAEKGKNLLFSILLYPTFIPVANQFLLSQLLSLSIKEELAQYSAGFSIKWPNDIYWKEKKICGILIENDLQGRSISRSIGGIGININQKTFYSSAPNPVSLYQITGKEHNCLSILSGILARVDKYYKYIRENQTEKIVLEYHKSLFRKDIASLFADKNGTFTAQVKRVEPSGTLVLQDDDGNERKYQFKEVYYIL